MKFYFLALLLSLGVFTAPSSLKASTPDLYGNKYWEGFYISGQMGSGWNSSHLKFTNPNYFNTLGDQLVGSKFHFDPSAFVGGSALGFHYQIHRLVLGLEAGLLYLHLKESKPSPFFSAIDTFTYNIQWLAHTKAHLGYARERLFIFITGGWAGSEVNLKLQDVSTTPNIEAKLNKWVNGWTLGAGVDWKLTYHFSLGLAYDYVYQEYQHKKASCSQCGTGVGFGTPSLNNSIKTQFLLLRANFYL